MAVATETATAPGKESFAALLDESLGAAAGLEGTVVKGTRDRDRERHRADRCRPQIRRPRPAQGILRRRASRPRSRSATPSRSILERMEDKNGEAAAVAREGAARGGLDPAREELPGRTSASPASSSAASRAASPSISTAPSPSCRAARSTSARCATSPRCWARRSRSRSSRWTARAATSSCRAAPCSRRAAPRQRSELVASLKEGQILDGVVKNITDYGAFVDLGGVDGLLHVTDIAWRRINHPVRGAAHRPDRQGAGHPLQPRDPAHLARHEAARGRSVGGRRAQIPGRRASFKGRVTNITDYGAFVELEPGVEGLVHVSEMSWTKKNVHPGKIVSTSQEVEVMVLDVDPQQAPHQPRPQAVPGQSVGGLRREVPGRHRARGRGQEHHRVRPVRRPARRHRRHGASLRPRLAEAGRRGDQGLQEGRHGQGQGARRRRREGAHLARHQAARRRSVRASIAELQEGRRRHLHGHRRSPTAASRSTLGRRHARLHPQGRAVARPRRAAPRPLRRRREGRRQDHRARPRRRARSRCRSRRARSTRRSRRWPNSARPIPAPASATSSARRSAAARARREGRK